MRTLIWSSTAVVLLVTAGLFVAANYVARHPDSFVGRFAMNVYHVWNPMSAACEGAKPALEVAQPAPTPAPQNGLTPAGTLTADLEVVEPIVVDPTEQEPPLAFPRLPPEIAAAIERLALEEESDSPPQPFDGPDRALRMPYADEEVEVLPKPIPVTGSVEDAGDLPGSYGFFFLPPSCWQMVCDKLMESLRQLGEAKPANEEPADDGTQTEDSPGLNELQHIPYEHYHSHGCPYTGGCPSPYPYRYVQPVTPVPAPTVPAKKPTAPRAD